LTIEKEKKSSPHPGLLPGGRRKSRKNLFIWKDALKKLKIKTEKLKIEVPYFLFFIFAFLFVYYV